MTRPRMKQQRLPLQDTRETAEHNRIAAETALRDPFRGLPSANSATTTTCNAPASWRPSAMPEPTATPLHHTLLRLRHRARQLHPPHAAIVRVLSTQGLGPPTEDEILAALRPTKKANREALRQAIADLTAAGIVTQTDAFPPTGRREHRAPLRLLQLAPTHTARRSAE